MIKKPRVVFVIPFASRKVVSDWHLTSLNLRQTLCSVFNSSDGDFRIVVAGNELPDFELPIDSRLKFLQLEQSFNADQKLTHDDCVDDKMTKLGAAWDFAKTTWNPQYVMKLDADDFISTKLVSWLNNVTDEPGFRIRLGWYWKSESLLACFTEKFDELCGSCLIVRSDVADMSGPFFVNSDEERSRMVDNHSIVPVSRISTILLNDCHQRAEAQFAHLGFKISDVPFGAAVYRVASKSGLTFLRMKEGIFQESNTKIISIRWLLGRMRRTRLVARKLQREFCLP